MPSFALELRSAAVVGCYAASLRAGVRRRASPVDFRCFLLVPTVLRRPDGSLSPRRALLGALLGLVALVRCPPPSSLVQHLGKTDPLFSAGLVLAYGRTPSPPAAKETAVVSIELNRKLGQVDPRFLSFSIDTSQVVGGFWWSEQARVEVGRGSARVPPFDFDRPRLERLAQALAPAFLRVGGTEADHVYYAVDHPAPEPLPDGYEFVLTPHAWGGLQRFVARTGLELYFTVNAGPGPRDAEGQWRDDNARTLLQYAARHKQEVAVLELGNEVNGHWFIHGLGHQPSPTQYARDLERFRGLAQQSLANARIAGPASVVFPVVGEGPAGRLPFLEGVLEQGRGSFDIVSWHFYPQQSRRCPLATRRATLTRLLNPLVLDEGARWGRTVLALRDRFAPSADVWLGETGHAQCGGEPGVSDRFGAGLWWLDQLGSAARDGQKLVVRQTLVGSDYGLIDHKTLRANPDFYNSLLWKRLMGARVLRVRKEGQNPYLRAYAHCGPAGGGGVTLLSLNLHPTRQAKVVVPGVRGVAEHYLLHSKALDSRDLYLNGEPLSAGSGPLPTFQGRRAVHDELRFALPPATYSFVHLPEIGAPACQ